MYRYADVYGSNGDYHVYLERAVTTISDIYIDISRLAHELGEETCHALFGIHGFSGCDFIASFYWKGKQAVYKVAHGKKRKNYLIRHLDQVGDTASVPPGIVDILVEVVCDLYGKTVTN